jgi:hypothetical protein
MAKFATRFPAVIICPACGTKQIADATVLALS